MTQANKVRGEMTGKQQLRPVIPRGAAMRSPKIRKSTRARLTERNRRAAALHPREARCLPFRMREARAKTTAAGSANSTSKAPS